MVTSAFKKYISCMLEANKQTSKGLISVTTTGNQQVYLTTNFTNSVFPYTVTSTLTLSATNAGIALGSGTTAATANDYRIESPFTSGISATVSQLPSITQDGDPKLTYTIVVSNTSSSSINISEIAYNQTVNASTVSESTSVNSHVVCFDRTVLDTPITLGAGETCVINYSLKTSI